VYWVFRALLIGLAAALVGRPAGTAGAPPDVEGGHRVYLPLLAPEPRSVAAPRFGVARGLYDRPFMLPLACDTAGAVIRYTTDGSAPGPDRGRVYAAPFAVSTTTVVRAAAFKPGLAPSEVATHSFIFPAAVAGQPDAPPGLPATWGTPPDDPAGGPVPADYGMDPEVAGDPRYRDELAAGLRALPSLSLAMAPDDLFGADRGLYLHPDERGDAWERPVSAELVRTDGVPGFQVDAGIRVAGFASRKHRHTPKKSLSLRFRSAYGPARLHYPLFPGGVTAFDTLRLRAGFNDSFPYLPWRGQYIRDQWGRDTQRAMGWTAARGVFVHLYLNGLYWGVYNLTEEPTAAFAADHLGGRASDYDVIESSARGGTGVEDGDRVAYDRLVGLTGLDDPSRYAEAAALLNIPQHIDYMLVQMFGANLDWPLTNWRAARNRAAGGGFQFFVWDYEVALDLLMPGHGLHNPGNNDDISTTAGVDGLHGRLVANAEYRLAFADRVRRHFFDEGALSAARAGDRYAALAAALDQAIVAESARWGDGPVGPYAVINGWRPWHDFWRLFGEGHPQTRDDEWAPERDRLLGAYFPNRTATVLGQLCARGLYPPVAAPAFDSSLTADGAGAKLTMVPAADGCPGARRDGTIFYTLDGADPRRPGSGDPTLPWSGDVAPQARAYRVPLSLSGYRRVKARLAVQEGGRWVWGALTETAFGRPPLAITEIMYHPAQADAEFLEITNIGAASVDLGGMSTEGVTITFPPGTALEPGGRLVLVQDALAFQRAYGDEPIGGVYDGRLANEGETVALRDALGRPVAGVTYDDAGFWPLSPDGEGYSLVPIDPARAGGDPESWRASARLGGSPGLDDPDPPYERVLIHEVLAHSPAPLEDAIELYNPGPRPADIGGWFLSDDRDDLRKFRVPDGTVIAPGGYAVFYEHALRLGVPAAREVVAGAPSLDSPPASPPSDSPPASRSPLGFGSGFALSAEGDGAYLGSADRRGLMTGYIHGLEFGAADPGAPFGRFVTRAGPDFVAVAAPTFGVDAPASVEAFRLGRGAPNAPPRVGPVVLSEIMYHPRAGGDEFIEIHNIAGAAVPLGDADAPANAWRFTAGVDFAFPAGAEIAAGGRALVVGADPAKFRRARRVPAGVPVFGPYTGQLDNGGETLALARPGPPDDGAIPLVEVDRVRFDDAAPWREAADGGGPSLERIDEAAFGNDPDNWAALRPGGTPGEANAAPRSVFLPVVVSRR